MPRPIKTRRIGHIPANKEFYPKQSLEHSRCIELSFEEVEAIRLADYEGLDQIECAELMQVSRGTLQRIVKESRSKVAEAICYGLPIIIKGGNYNLEPHSGRCRQCNYNWNETANFVDTCPTCGSPDIVSGATPRRQHRNRRGRNRNN